MQIDTKNRHYNGTDFKPDLMPAASQAPPDAPYSGLLECPCTDRIQKKVEQTYGTKTFGTCIKTVVNATQCFEAVGQVVNSGVDTNATVSSSSLPKDCSMVVYKNGTTVAVPVIRPQWLLDRMFAVPMMRKLRHGDRSRQAALASPAKRFYVRR